LWFRIPDPDPGFYDQNYKRLLLKKKLNFFLDQKLQFTFPLAYIKDAQATGEAFSPQKRTSSTKKHENSGLFFYFCGSFLPSWIRIRIRNLSADPDPDLATQINADPCESGSETLHMTEWIGGEEEPFFLVRLAPEHSQPEI
jgi:hypothetical protein